MIGRLVLLVETKDNMTAWKDRHTWKVNCWGQQDGLLNRS
jgi:hypothetical protein